MALSSQFESSREPLYAETRQMLETLEMTDDGLQPIPIEQVQAWLLIAFYELSRSSYRRASISAGRAFRLVQLARLHELDTPEQLVEGEDPVAKEERRRTFWVAYCLDRLICMRSNSPLTLSEEVVSAVLHLSTHKPRRSSFYHHLHRFTANLSRVQICTRLPSPELAFQSGHPIPGCFLTEALSSGDHSFLSPLTESAVLVTICGRALSHSQVSAAERAFGNPSLDFWLRHEWLDGMLTRTLDSLAVNAHVVSAMADPMLLFSFMMAHATAIFMCQIAESSGLDNQYRPTVVESQQRATRAAREIAALAKTHEQIGYFKVRHPMLPQLTCHMTPACRLYNHIKS